MANKLYDKGRQKFLDGEISWSSDVIKCDLIDTGHYTVNLANDEFLEDVSSEARVSASGALSGKTTTAGEAGAASVTFSGVVGSTCSALIVYQDTGYESTSSLIAYIDTATGLPIEPDGADIIINWSSGKVFNL
jgi:hypothetical protein